MRGAAGRLGWLVGTSCALALCAGVARAEYCAYGGTVTFSVGGVTVDLSPRPTLAPCGLEGASCADGSVCQRLAATDTTLYCAPLLTDAVVWSCSGGCVCPTIGPDVATHVPVPTTTGATCLCDYGATASFCPGTGVGDAERFIACHTALSTADMGRLVALPDGDCDGDGFSNTCEGMGGDRCEPCAHPDPATCPSDVVDIVVPACTTDGGSATVDAGATTSDAGADGGAPSADAASAPNLDASSEDGLDGASALGDPLARVTFRGAGGCACGIAAPTHGSHGGAWGAALAVALAALGQGRRRRA